MSPSLQRIIRASSFDPDIARRQLAEFNGILAAIRRVPDFTTEDNRLGQEQKRSQMHLKGLQAKLEKSSARMELLLGQIESDMSMFNSYVQFSFAGRTMSDNLRWMSSLMTGTDAEKPANEVVRLILEYERKYGG